jgi:serralysin
MLHISADSFDGVQSGFARVPIDLLSQTPDDSGLDLIRTNALSSSALTPDGSAGLAQSGMGIRPADAAALAMHAIAVDQADGFHFSEGTTSSIVPLPPSPQLSPTQEQEVTFVAGADSGGNVAATSLAAWNGDNPATYKANTTEAKWGASTAVGTAGGTVTYAFDTASAWTATEQAVFVGAYALWADLANIAFTQVADPATANIVIVRPGSGGAHFDGLFTSGDPNAGKTGQGVLWSYQSTGNTLNIQTSASSFGPINADPNTFGGHVWGTVVHEEGHSLGLGHGGPYNGAVVPATQQFSAQDTTLWTIMSYIEPTDGTAKYVAEYPVTGTNWGQQDLGGGSFADRSPTTPMMLDILAAQRLYGAPTTTAYNGGQVFGFNCNIGDASKPFYDFTVNTHPVVTIWDAGTNNTLDLSGFTTSSNVNLNPGTFSSCNGMVNNIGIAFNTAINTFVGGSGDDTVTANNNGDLIQAGSGGNDTFTGGTGNDGFYFGATYTTADRANGGAGTNNQVGLEGTYAGVTIGGTQFQNIQVLALKAGFNYSLTLQDDLTPAGTTFKVWAYNMTAANNVNIDASAETNAQLVFYLGNGNDTVNGGQAGNIFFGHGGGDSLVGGAGQDIFTYMAVSDSTSTGYDLIRNFTVAQDKFDLPTGTTVTGIDPMVNSGTLHSGATFDTELAVAVGAAQLAAGHAVLFHATVTDFAVDNLWLIVDANGVAGYQAGADYVFNVTGSDYTGLTTGNFI